MLRGFTTDGAGFTIEHSGRKHVALGRARIWTGGMYMVWPVSEYLSRRKVSRRMRRLIKRKNPHGVIEGSMPIGARSF